MSTNDPTYSGLPSGRPLAICISIGLAFFGAKNLINYWDNAGKQQIDFPTLNNLGGRKPEFLKAYYKRDENGSYKVILDDKISKESYLDWKDMALYNQPISAQSNFYTWDERRQRDYLVQIKSLAEQMPTSCKGRVEGCDPESSYVQRVNELHQQYRMSTILELWQLQKMEQFYVAALADRDVRAAVINWDYLSNDQKLDIGYKLVSYEYIAYQLPLSHSLPALVIEEINPKYEAETD